MKIFAGVILFLLTQTIFAFPEMIRHGYTNCIACHISPSGGGVLNSYGKNLSAELLSTWSSKGEEGFLHGAVDTSAVDKWLALGGDYRGVDLQEKNTRVDTGVESTNSQWINMQVGLEAGIIQPFWSLVAYFGQYNTSDPDNLNQIEPYMNRYYLLLKPTDELIFKVGRFQPNFGINVAEHFYSTRVNIGMGILSFRSGAPTIEDKNTAELFWINENYNDSVSLYKIVDNLTVTHDKGGTVNVSRVFQDKFKIGIQYLRETNDIQAKNIFGITSAFGWSDKWVTLAEADRFYIKPSDMTLSAPTTGVAMFQRTSYELFKGFNLAFVNDYYQGDMSDGTTIEYKYGPGIMWYPRPHFDFELFYNKEQNAQFTKPGDYAYLMTHYYF